MKVINSTDTATRPANTTVYTAGDVVGQAILTFSNISRRAGEGVILQSALCIDSAYEATRPDLELWLFSSTISDLDADNAPWTPTDAQLLTLVGIVAFPVASFKQGTASGNGAQLQSNLNIPLDVDTLYGVLVMRNGYTPISAETFKVVLGIVQEDE